jgi:ABC-type multidrug transport system permease subunit
MNVVAGVRPPTTSAAGRPGAAVLVLDQAGYAVRELWRSRLVLIFTFILPLVWLLLIGMLAGNEVLPGTGGVRAMQFATPTAAVMGILFATYPPLANSLAAAREARVLKRLQGTPLPMWSYLVGRTVAAVLLALASVAVMFLIGTLAYGVEIIWRTVPATLVTLLVGIGTLSLLGLAVGALAPSASTAQSFAMASAVGVTFLSGMFMIGSEPPAWLDSLAAVFPVQHLADSLQDQLNPFLTGGGWNLPGLAVIAAWGAAALAVAAWGLRREPAVARTGRARTQGEAGRESGAAGAGRNGPATLVLDQANWATSALWRDVGSTFFAVVMPVALYALMAMMYGDSDLQSGGRPFVFHFACGMAVYGIAVTTFINTPEAVATARDRGVLKRLRGTPLAPWHYLAGRTASAMWVGLLTTALVFVVGVAFFAVRIPLEALPLAVVVLVLGTLTLAACGFALAAVTPSGRATAVVGLAILLPLSFFSDIFVIGGMPAWMSTVGSVFPLWHFVHGLAGALDGAGLAAIAPNLAVMAAWLVAATAVAVRRFRWEPRR